MTIAELIADVKSDFDKIKPAVQAFLAANPGVVVAGETDADNAVAAVSAKLDTVAQTAADAEVTKVVPAIAPELVPILNGLIDDGIKAAQSAADDRIAQLTTLKTAIAPSAAG